jgi:hypothetical protein
VAAAAGCMAERMAAASSLGSASLGVASARHWAVQQPEQPSSAGRLTAAAAADGGSNVGLGLAGSGVHVASAASYINSNTASGGGAAAGGAAGVLDPGLRLRVRSLRGPLEDAMRCYAEVRAAG